MTQPTTELDLARQRARVGGDDPKAQLQFNHCFADTELFLLLECAAKPNAISPLLFPVEGVSYGLVFDLPERLAEFSEIPVDYIALPGRAIVALLADRGVGIGLNLGVAPSSYLMPPAAVDWMARILDQPMGPGSAPIRSLAEPGQVPSSLIQTIGNILAQAHAPPGTVYLARATYADGDSGHLLVVVGLPDGAEPILRQTLAETISFAGLDIGRFDLIFVEPGTELADRAGQIGKPIF